MEMIMNFIHHRKFAELYTDGTTYLLKRYDKDHNLVDSLTFSDEDSAIIEGQAWKLSGEPE